MKKQSIFIKLTYLAFGLFVMVSTGCKKDGCTDSNATNYDADAKSDDGSCKYPIDDADGMLGGALYDKFYDDGLAGWTGPNDASINEADITDYGNFYRCKQCHGWDLDGKNASYIDRAPNTGRPDVANGIRAFINSSTDQELFDAIKKTGGAAVDAARTADGTNVSLGGNAHPDYGKILTDAQIWDLTKFLKVEAFDVSKLYDINTTGVYPTGSRTFSNIGKDGNAANGITFYTANCGSSNCHGPDGTAINIEDEDKSVGYFLRNKPYEAQHKAKFGQPGSTMPATPMTLQQVKDLLKAGNDTIAFPDL